MTIRRRPPNPPVAVKHLTYQVKAPDAEPRNILEKIVWHKETEVAQLRERLPLADLQRQVLTAPPARDFIAALRQGPTSPTLIAEVKKPPLARASSAKTSTPWPLPKPTLATGLLASRC